MTGPEQGLREIALETRMEVVIIRPPLVHGPGVKANFSAMMRWLHHRLIDPQLGTLKGTGAPASWLKLAVAMVGKQDVVQRLRRWVSH